MVTELDTTEWPSTHIYKNTRKLLNKEQLDGLFKTAHLSWIATNHPTWASLVAQTVKRLPAMRETQVRFLGREDLLEKEMAIHSSTLAWKIPWTEEPDRLQSMGLQRVSGTWLSGFTFTFIPHGHSFSFRKRQEQELLWETNLKVHNWIMSEAVWQRRDLSTSPSGSLTRMYSNNIMLKKH